MNNLQNLFNDVVEDEAEEDDLDPKNKVVPSIHVAQELALLISAFHCPMAE